MKQSAAFAAIRRIATLGYSRELALPALVEAIRDIVPYEKVNFVWLDDEYNDLDWYGPLVIPADVMRFYLEQFYNRLECEVIPSNRELMTRLGTDRSANLPGFHDSEFFNTVLLAGGNRHYLRLAVRNGSRPLGVLYLLRSCGSRDFTGEEEKRLAQLAPWLAHALCSPPKIATDEKLIDNENGLIVVDAKGAVQSFSRGARELLHRAAGVPVARETLGSRFDWAHPLIGRLLQALAGAGADGCDAPTQTIRNSFGCFVLRAYWLEAAASGSGTHVAIQVQQQIPLALRLMQSRHLRKLPPREQEACLLLAQGLTTTDVAKRMGISRNGAIYHMRSSYARLGISRQEDLVGALLKPEA